MLISHAQPWNATSISSQIDNHKNDTTTQTPQQQPRTDQQQPWTSHRRFSVWTAACWSQQLGDETRGMRRSLMAAKGEVDDLKKQLEKSNGDILKQTLDHDQKVFVAEGCLQGAGKLTMGWKADYKTLEDEYLQGEQKGRIWQKCLQRCIKCIEVFLVDEARSQTNCFIFLRMVSSYLASYLAG